MLPSFVIIGAMKAGTTSLFQYLSGHPDLVASSIKETNFFRSEKDFAQGVEWYESLYSHGSEGQRCFEASPNYTKQHEFSGVVDRMRSVLPAAKLVFVARDPIERAVSHYVHNKRVGRVRESFSEAIREPGSHYVLTSMYRRQIDPFLDHYGSENLHVMDTRQLSNDRAAAMKGLLRFLDLSCDDAFLEKTEKQRDYNRAQGFGRGVASPLERSLTSMVKSGTLKTLIRTACVPLRSPIEPPRLTEDDRKVLEDQLAEDVAAFRSFSGLDFEHWSL